MSMRVSTRHRSCLASDSARATAAVLVAAAFIVAPASCGLFGNGGGGGNGDTGIDAAYRGSWVRLDKEQYLYLGDDKVYARESAFDSWSELTLRSASSSEITASDNGVVSGGYAGTLVTIRPDATKADWLKVESSGGSAYYRRAGAKTASFRGTLKKDSPAKAAGGKALVPAGGISLVIQNVLNAQDRQTVTTDPLYGSFTATNIIAGDSFTVTPAAGSAVTAAPVTVTPQQRGENVGVVSAPNKPYNFKAEYAFSPTPLEFGYFSAKFMIAGYQFTPISGAPFDLYYDVTLRIRNTGTASVSDIDYVLEPTDAGPIAPGAAYDLSLHLRRPSPVADSKDVEVEAIDVTITDAEGYVWGDRVELYFWRRLVYIEVLRYQSGPLLGEIATPEKDASGAWLPPQDYVEWYYLPYRREGYTIGIYPATETQGQTKYSIGFEGLFLARVGEFETFPTDLNEPNNSATAATMIGYGQCVMGIIGPGDADFFKTGAETAPVEDTTPPAPVTDFVATPGDRSITLTWTEPGDSDYREVEISGSPDDLWRSPDKGTTSYTFSYRDFPQIQNGTSYSFEARTVDYSNNRSDPVSPTPNPITPFWGNAGATSYKYAGSFSSKNPPPPAGKFKAPCDVALDGSGNYIVADTGNNRVQRITTDGTCLFTWGNSDGAAGSAAGKFNAPSGVAVTGSTLYVADTGNNRVQAFDLASLLLTPIPTWGSSGIVSNGFSSPNALDCDGTNLYVSDGGNNRIQVFNATTGVFVKTWTEAFQGPIGLGLSPDKTFLYVVSYVSSSNFSIKRIPVTTPTGDALSVAEKLNLTGHSWYIPSDVAVDSTRLYVSERHGTSLVAFSLSDWARQWWRSGASQNIGGPVGLVLDGSGRLVVADAGSGMDRIARYAAATGAFDSSVGGPSYPGDGDFNRPYDVASSPDGREIYVSDWAYNRIQIFSSSDSSHPFLERWGGAGGAAGTADGQFNQPRFITADASGRIYVADSYNNRVQVLDGSTGSLITKWGESAPSSGTAIRSFYNPWDVSISPDGNVAFVADQGNSRIQKFSTIAPYSYIGSFPCARNPTYILAPTSIAADTAVGLEGSVVIIIDDVVRFDGSGGGPIWPEIVYGSDATTLPGERKASIDYDVETDADGNIYASVRSVSGTFEIRKYSPSGGWIATLPQPTGGYSGLAGIGLVPLTASYHPGRIYVADEYAQAVFFFDPVP
jgi:DNA-binding beta-propeller fold protein YncE